jgi:hypothetical protein
MFDDALWLSARASRARVLEVHVYASTVVHAIQLVYVIDNQRVDGPIAGTVAGATLQIIQIREWKGEYIREVDVCLDEKQQRPIQHLVINTNMGVSQKFGSSNAGSAIALTIPEGHRVCGFHGCLDPELHTIGLYHAPLSLGNYPLPAGSTVSPVIMANSNPQAYSAQPQSQIQQFSNSATSVIQRTSVAITGVTGVS